MARVVELVAADYKDSVRWEKVITKDLSGARRFIELSKRLGRPAPVPSIFIDAPLVFDVTPGREKLEKFLDKLISETA